MVSVFAPVALAGPALAVDPPASPTLVFEETFESASPLQDVTTFNGYTADPYWVNNGRCNGILVSEDTATTAFNGCAGGPVNSLGLIATALALHDTGVADTSNVVVAGYTHGGSGTATDLIQIETPAITVTNNRFYFASVDVGAQNCFAKSPEHQFFLADGVGSQTTLGAAVEVCDKWDGVRSSITTETVSSPQAVRWDQGTTMTLGVNNLQPSSAGNDAAIDNLRLYEVTPSMYKDFVPSPIVEWESTTLIFTLVNTDELLAKTGIYFTDTMVGLEVVDGVIGGDCANIAGTASGSVINITNADILDGVASCTIEVEVQTVSGAGTYTNGPDEISNSGFVKPPTEDATVEIAPAVPSFTVDKATASVPVAVGDTLLYTFEVENTGNTPIENIVVADAKCAATPTLDSETATADTVLEVGETQMYSCTSIGVDATELAAGEVPNDVTVSGEPLAGVLEDATDAEVTPLDLQPPVATDDSSTGNVPGSTVTIDVLGSDTDPNGDLDPTSVAIDDPNYDPSTGTLVVPGEGTWTVDPVTGAISFTPEPGFEGDPTPISYTVADSQGLVSDPATVTVDYAPSAVDDESLGNTIGDPVTVDVLANDGDIDPTTVMITDPATGLPVTSLVVPGEGTWDVDPVTGAITFTPEPGFLGDPTPIGYTATDNDGNEENATVVVGYAPEAAPDESLDNPSGSTVTIDVLGNDPGLNLDPTTVMIFDASGNPVTELVVPGEGTWSVDPVTGAISFTPEVGFVGNPTPISYSATDDLGRMTPPSEVAVTYLDPPVAAPDESLDNVPGSTVTIDVLGNDPSLDLDPTTVMIVDADGNPVTELVVAGEGTWSVDPVSGEISFTPEAGFDGDPTPIAYIATDVLGARISPEVVTVTYADPVVTSIPVLAFTGIEAWQMVLAAMLAMGAGMGFIALARREEDAVEA